MTVNSTGFVLPPVVERVRDALPEGIPVALAGGAVRDLLMGRSPHDYDFILPIGAMRIARQVADRIGAAYFPLNEQRDYARLVWRGEKRMLIDFSAYQGPDMQADLLGRDFTFNAMAVDLYNPSELIDPLGGIKDLLARQIRLCSPRSFHNDPVRILRAVRFANSLNAKLPPETLELMRSAMPLLGSTSPERMRDELFKILDLRQAATAIRILDSLGALPAVLPELTAMKGVQQSPPHINDVWEHTLDALNRLQSVLAVLSPDYDADEAGSLILGMTVLRLGRFRAQLAQHLAEELNPDRSLQALLNLAVLYHDAGKPHSRTIDADERIRYFGHEQVGAALAMERAQALRLSKQESERLQAIVRHHMRPPLLTQAGGIPSRKAVYHFFRDAGVAGVDVCLLTMADMQATYGTTLPQEKWAGLLDVVRALLEGWWDRKQEVIAPPPLINGHDVMKELGLPPGRRLGEILEAIREAQAEGEVSTPEEALDFARRFV